MLQFRFVAANYCAEMTNTTNIAHSNISEGLRSLFAENKQWDGTSVALCRQGSEWQTIAYDSALEDHLGNFLSGAGNQVGDAKCATLNDDAAAVVCVWDLSLNKENELRQTLAKLAQFREAVFLLVLKQPDSDGLEVYDLDAFKSIVAEYLRCKRECLDTCRNHIIYYNSEFYRQKSSSDDLTGNYKTTEELLTCFRGKSIAVIGNGHIADHSSEEIDRHDVVIRINNYNITDECMHKVGKKVTLWCVNGSVAIKYRNQEMAIVPLPKNRIGSLASHFRHARLIFADQDWTEEYNIENATIGFSLLVLLSKLGLSADAYGFDFFQNTGHYWEPTYSHDFAHDKTLSNEQYIVENLRGVRLVIPIKKSVRRSVLQGLRKYMPHFLIRRAGPIRKWIKKLLGK